MLRLETRTDSIVRIAASASGMGMLSWMNWSTSGLERMVSLTISAIVRLVVSESGNEKFSRVRAYVGSGCSKGTKKHDISGDEHTCCRTSRSIASGGTPEIKKCHGGGKRSTNSAAAVGVLTTRFSASESPMIFVMASLSFASVPCALVLYLALYVRTHALAPSFWGHFSFSTWDTFRQVDWPSWGVGKPPIGVAVMRRPLSRVLTPFTIIMS